MLQLPKQTETSVLFQSTTFWDDLKETLYNHSSILFATEMLHHVPLFQVAKVYSFLNILPNKYYTDKTLLVFNGQTGEDWWRSGVWGDLLGSILCSLKRPCPLQPASHMFLLKTLTMCICNSFYIESYDHMNYTNTWALQCILWSFFQKNSLQYIKWSPMYNASKKGISIQS